MVRYNGGNQAHLGGDENESIAAPGKCREGPVECLGITFENNDARRTYFLERLKERLSDPEYRKTDGFPIGKDEDILALSDPPYYTACPNPFIEEYIEHYGKPYELDKPYNREPFATDVSEGKSDPIYNVHSYHTKVPPQAICHYIRHYTDPGDLILDCFAGTGMTGLALQMLSNEEKRTSHLKPDIPSFDKFYFRNAILIELSPAASSIADGYNSLFHCSANEFEAAIDTMLSNAENLIGYLYKTIHVDGRQGKINYIIWSDVFLCSNCNRELIFWDNAVDLKSKIIYTKFKCPHCNAELSKNNLVHKKMNTFDQAIGKATQLNMQVPVLISYRIGKEKYEKRPDRYDLELIEKLESIKPTYWYPTNRMMNSIEVSEKWGDKWRAGTSNFQYIHELYTRRNLEVLGYLWKAINEYPEPGIRHMLRFVFTATCMRHSLMNTFRFNVSFPSNVTLGTLYIASLAKETNFLDQFKNKALKRVLPFLRSSEPHHVLVSTQSATKLTNIPTNSIDYIFVDPPFGDNLAYAELNFAWEAWLKVFTDVTFEAIVSNHQHKDLTAYQSLMRDGFSEMCRVLKPGHWITVEFHNSKNSVWNAIQEALLLSGFVIADVHILDKKSASFNAINAAGAVKKDLVISAYKPNNGLEERFKIEAGTEDGIWDFVRIHLGQLPIFAYIDGHAEVIAERQNYLIFDRMVAFHLRRGASVPLSAAEFYVGLAQRFPEREGMYFLPEQAAEYDKKRMTVKEIIQLQLSITDESSAIKWIKQQLTKKPQTLQDLTPTFMKELAGWSKHEKLLELRELLEQNFIIYEGEGEVPGPIHSYLSTTFKELRNLSKTDPTLVSKARNRWYNPDPRRAGDLEKLREKALLKEFHLIAESKKRIKEFRIEAVRAGFKKCWDEGDHKTILDVAKKLPSSVVEEDSHLLMYTDLARMRQG